MPYVYVQATQQVRGNGIGIAALVMGLIGLVLTVATGWIPIVGFFLILVPTILAIIFGLVGKAQARRGARHGGTATAGLTCGFVGLLLTAFMQLCWGLLLGSVVMSVAEIAHEMPAAEEFDQLQQEIQQQLEADWTQIQAGHPELEIEIDESDSIAGWAPPSSESAREWTDGQSDSVATDEADGEEARRVTDERLEGAEERAAEPPVI